MIENRLLNTEKVEKIGVDMDEVLAQFMPRFLKFYNLQHQTNFTIDQIISYDLHHILGGTAKEIIRAVYNFYESDDFNYIEPVPGANQGINKLSSFYDLIIITSRPHLLENKTSDWLDKHFPHQFKDLILTNQYTHEGNSGSKKLAICQRYGVKFLVDDCLDHLVGCHQYDTHGIIFEQPWNRSYTPQKVRRAKNWEEVVGLIN